MRLAEIFELVNNELKLVGKSGKLPAGAAITGAGAKIPDIVELAKQELKLPAQLGIPELSDVEFVSAEFPQKTPRKINWKIWNSAFVPVCCFGRLTSL